MDEPTTFYFDDKIYEPADFRGAHQYMGTVTLRQALANSLNIPAVKVAEMVGYDKVAKTAHDVGLNIDIKATPSIALGAYEVTPLEIAGAYTVFPNMGTLVKPGFIKTIRTQNGNAVYEATIERKPAMDPRVAYIMVNMLQEVLRSGTGAGVRGRGFVLPAAGKTGTSRDGWFAGFTSKLICIVWVGFDDNRDFKLEGAKSALPIWVEFMKRAHQHPAYRKVHDFEAPDGVVTADVDLETGELATPNCPHVRSEVFIAGTQPVEVCHLHGGRTQVAGWDPSAPPSDKTAASIESPQIPPSPTLRSIPISPAPAPQAAEPEKKHRGFFGRLKDIFK
jgi:penicillin-binding protein 1B